MSIFEKMRQFVFSDTTQIPYLEIPSYEDPISIPYLQPSGAFTSPHDVLGLPKTTAITELLSRFYDEVLSLITQTSTLIIFGAILAGISTYFAFSNDIIIAYGDAESHLNIAKRVLQSLTPGLSQLGGIWLPVPHLLMIPFVSSDFLWRTGLAGSIVSSISFIIAALYLFKLTMLLTRNKLASFVAFLVFALNPNILYLQSTPMTELPLLMFFTLSTYFFLRYLKKEREMLSLIGAAFFGLCASMSRYDGWFLVAFEAIILGLMYFPKISFSKLTGKIVLFSTLAFFGILTWIAWGFIILGDPFYFTTSEFSAKSQQAVWSAHGELPAYHNILTSLQYYTYTSMENVGIFIFAIATVGLIFYLFSKPEKIRFLTVLLLLCPFIFYVITLFMGQSVIFIPSLTPASFEWNLFNVRYGVMMVPISAFFFAYLLAKLRPGMKVNILLFLAVQTFFFATHVSPTISLADGTVGLSRYKQSDAQDWINAHYDSGLVLIDDVARTISIVRTDIPMQNIIYVGNKPYWEESLTNPDKYATWIIMQKNDSVWNSLYMDEQKRGLLYSHFNKVYTSPDILIFKKIQK